VYSPSRCCSQSSPVHVVAAKFGWAEVQQVGGKKRIPLAPSVAAALLLCFLLGCLQPIGGQGIAYLRHRRIRALSDSNS
jgi:hypothetical protein